MFVTTIVYLFAGLCLVSVVAYVAWMRRVLRGGPLAMLVMLILSMTLAFLLLPCAVLLAAVALSAVSGGSDVVPLVSLAAGVNLAFVAVAVPTTIGFGLFGRDVREWTDVRI